MARSDIEKVIEQVPGLNDFGIGVFNPHAKTASERQRELVEGKATLLDSIEAVYKCCEWLKDVERIKGINTRHNSYGLKHIAETEIGYITNGVFIAAAILLGFDYRIINGGPNVAFNMSESSIKAIRRRQKELGRSRAI